MSIWDAALVALRTMTYAGTFTACGAVWFLCYCDALVADAERRKIRRIVLACAALGLLAGAAHILVTAGSMSGRAPGMWDTSLVRMVWQAGTGNANLIRAAGLSVAAWGTLRSRPAWPALLAAFAAATSFAWTGHSRSVGPDALPLLLAVHLAGVAFWLGALAPLSIVAGGAETARIAAAAARFGAAALYVVAAMLSAGAILLWRLLGGAAPLWTSTYGRYAMLKLVFVAGLLCLAALNHLRLTPRLLAGDDAAVRGLRVSVHWELLLGLFILAATGMLTTVASPPALD